MPTYLLKTEPDDYSFADLVRDKRTTWTGVSNPAARIHLRSMRKGDDAFIYHTGDDKAIVGLARVVSDPRADPAKPGLNDRGEIAFPVVDLEPIAPLPMPVALTAIKADPRFASFLLVTNSRLSVMPVPPALASAIRGLGRLAKKR